MSRCQCDFDPQYHMGRNGDLSPQCRNEPDPDSGLCMPCLFGCAP